MSVPKHLVQAWMAKLYPDEYDPEILRKKLKDRGKMDQKNYQNYREIAQCFGVNPEAFRKRLARWEKANPNAKARGDIIIKPDTAKNEPRKLYRLSAVKPILEKIKKTMP